MRPVHVTRRPRRPLSIVPLALAGLMLWGAAGCVEQDDESPTEEDMKAIKENLLASAPTPKYAVNADLEGKVVYLGMDVDPPTIEPGKPVKLTHYWKSVAPTGDGWRLFTHLEGPNHQNFINADHGPVGGKYPVSQWKAGQIIRDEHTVTLPATWTHASVTVFVGVWRGPTRLNVKSGASDGQGRVIAAKIPVRASGAVQPPARKRYVARKTAKPIKIDGKADDQAWKDAVSSGAFVNTMTGAPAQPETDARLAWDDKYLYVLFHNADSDIWSDMTKRDDKLWTQEADELMIDADGNGRTYVEFQVAPTGAIFDTYLPEYRKYEDSIDPKRKQFSWNSGMIAKVNVEGTLNKRNDKDTAWTAELAIPLADVKGMDTKSGTPSLPPKPGDTWRINMYRMDMPKGQGQVALGWSPPLVGDFHVLDKFGDLVFADESGAVAPPPAAAEAKGSGGAGGQDKEADKGKDGKSAKGAKDGTGGAGGKGVKPRALREHFKNLHPERAVPAEGVKGAPAPAPAPAH